MSRINKYMYPKTIIRIPEDEFPDGLRIVWRGNNFVPKKALAEMANKAYDAIQGAIEDAQEATSGGEEKEYVDINVAGGTKQVDKQDLPDDDVWKDIGGDISTFVSSGVDRMRPIIENSMDKLREMLGDVREFDIENLLTRILEGYAKMGQMEGDGPSTSSIDHEKISQVAENISDIPMVQDSEEVVRAVGDVVKDYAGRIKETAGEIGDATWQDVVGVAKDALDMVSVSGLSNVKSLISGPSKIESFRVTEENQFDETMTIKGTKYKVAIINTPFWNLFYIRAWAHRKDWEDDRSVNIKFDVMTESTELKEVSGPVNIEGWSYSMSLTKKTNLPLDYVIEYVKEGSWPGLTADLAKMIPPLISSMSTMLTSEIKPNLPTAEQLASKYLGPPSPAVMRLLNKIRKLETKVRPYLEIYNSIIDAGRACTKIEGFDKDIKINYLGIDTYIQKARQEIMEYLNEKITALEDEIKKQIESVRKAARKQLENWDIEKLEEASLANIKESIQENMPDIDHPFFTIQCKQALIQLFNDIYEVIPPELLAKAGFIYEYGE